MPSRYPDSADPASTHRHLLAGGRLAPVPAPEPGMVEAGEDVVGVIRGSMTFARYCGAPIISGGSSALIAGSAPLVAGFVLADLAQRGRRRRRAQRAAAPQWRSTPLQQTVVTTRRLWCEVTTDIGSRWLHFAYNMIRKDGLHLTGHTLTLSFLDVEPLQLAGEHAPWCAAVIAHHRFGPDAPQAVPTLHAANATH